ncbi:testis-expressed protein 2 [Orussus abietinus]|uniref:testis-expressed protein 2 n=1 Tax=Orussus abietinus TaxID=222816 RepID=UPI0006256E27|nr:testis-expressed protein 2 [Orussus abietinus]XP_012271879.1 testis-expressed protein 2 [Orussus abietinus]
MTSKQSPGKTSLCLLKGKSIATSVPAIRYHASDDELEELYPSSEEEPLAPELEKLSPKNSPGKNVKSKATEGLLVEGGSERRPESNEDDLSEGTPPAVPWKMLSDIKGKITKSFEEKLSEMKNERKRSKRRSGENSSVSESEEFGDVTPTEESVTEKREKDSASPTLCRRGHAIGFSRFPRIKTGLKTKKSEDDGIESGVEAAESVEEDAPVVPDDKRDGIGEITYSDDASKRLRFLAGPRPFSEEFSGPKFRNTVSIYSQLKGPVIYRLLMLPLILCCSYYFIPLPAYMLGLFGGIFIAITVSNLITGVRKILLTPLEASNRRKPVVPVFKIPAVAEHAVVDRFEGWLNELPYKYDPENYHVARTNPVYFKLEGDTLRVMDTRNRIPKRTVWDETVQKPKFTKKRIYTLAGAKIELLPHGLIRRRRWSKKYPICVTFGKEALLECTTMDASLEDETSRADPENETPTLEEEETDEDLSQSRDHREVFRDIDEDEEEDREMKMFIFARADRQKEDWYRRLALATNVFGKRNSSTSVKDAAAPSTNSFSPSNESKSAATLLTISETVPEFSYNAYMTRYIETDSNPENGDVVWMNALLARVLFDMHKCPDTTSPIQDKIQRKLSNIKLPYFMESLHVSELKIGQGAPVIHKASKPVLDERGLWLDLDIAYDGYLTMTIETKLNLMKLKRAGSLSSNSNDTLDLDKPKVARSPMFDSDVEDSPETSTEEEDGANLSASGHGGASKESTPSQSSGRKFLSMVDKLAANKYFQHATELSYIRRAMEGVSNTEIRLMVSVSSIEGCLALNVPPPPADRLWYGFRNVPKISLTAQPALGEKTVKNGYVTKWIESKLLREFEKLVVLPNMDDLVIPLCPNYPYVSS